MTLKESDTKSILIQDAMQRSAYRGHKKYKKNVYFSSVNRGSMKIFRHMFCLEYNYID